MIGDWIARRGPLYARVADAIAEAVAHGLLPAWVGLPHGSADEFAQLALRHGVAVASGTSAAPDDRFSGHLRVCAGPAPDLIREGVQKLALAWSEMRARPLAAPLETALPV